MLCPVLVLSLDSYLNASLQNTLQRPFSKHNWMSSVAQCYNSRLEIARLVPGSSVIGDIVNVLCPRARHFLFTA